MTNTPHILRLISRGYHALLRAGGRKPDVAPFKRVLNAMWSGVATPLNGVWGQTAEVGSEGRS